MKEKRNWDFDDFRNDFDRDRDRDREKYKKFKLDTHTEMERLKLIAKKI